MTAEEREENALATEAFSCCPSAGPLPESRRVQVRLGNKNSISGMDALLGGLGPTMGLLPVPINYSLQSSRASRYSGIWSCHKVSWSGLLYFYLMDQPVDSLGLIFRSPLT